MQRHGFQLLGVLIIGGILGAALCFTFPRHTNGQKPPVGVSSVTPTLTKTLPTPTITPAITSTPTIASHSAQLMLNALNKTAGSSATPTHAATR